MNRAIPDSVVEEIRQRADIVEVINRAVPLKRGGSGVYKALCPFHNEKTPSFTVNAARQIFHCFGCNKGGDVFRFIMDKEGVDFPNAVHILANQVGVIIPDKVSYRQNPSEAQKQADSRERLYKLNEEFARFFERFLAKNPEGTAAQYLRKRALEPDSIAKFRLGAAPDEWDACLKYGESLGFSIEELILGGIVRKNEDSDRVYDFFRGRLIFPIWNEAGRVVGFSARTLDPDAKTAKYVNTPETPVFKKGAILYALPLARTAIAAEHKVILCEGQLDAIAFHRADMGYAVAPQGTGFTEEQARILKRYCDRVELAFDADSAGQKALMRAIEILLPLDFEVKIIFFPEGKDPDEIFRTGGAAALATVESNALDWLDYLIGKLPEAFDLNAVADKSRAAGEILKYVKLIGNHISREAYLKKISLALKIGDAALQGELDKLLLQDKRRENGGGFAGNAAKVQPPTSDHCANAEKLLLELALALEWVPKMLATELPPEYLSGSIVAKALESLISECDKAEKSAFASLLSEDDSGILTQIMVKSEAWHRDDAEKAIADSIAHLRSQFRWRKRTELAEKLKLASDEAEVMKIIGELQTLN